jgi:phenylacetate-CoA ligase
MNTRNIYLIIQKIKKYKPMFIDGYAESFNLIANYIREHKIKGIKINGMMSSAQTLDKNSRKIIEKEFKTKIYDKYGSREFSGIAYQCSARKGYHVNDESYLLEIIKNNRPAKPGKMGEIVITDLNNFCVPLIRYRIGDLAKAANNSLICSCGRQLSKIGSIKGRVQAIIIGQNGELIPGTFFAHLFKDYWYAIKQFQIIQKRNHEITLKIVKNDRFSQEIFDTIIREIKKYLGSQTTIHPVFVDNIPLGKTGKHQHSISKVKFDFQKINQHKK